MISVRISARRRPREGVVFELRTLGAIDLRNGTEARVDSVLLHTKRLSLLVYLCTSHPVQVQRRDTLVALLWPELDAAHARGALRHELSQLRRALGQDALRGRGVEAVGVNAEQIWCDASAFEAALDAGRPADALELWRGEFLPGLREDGRALQASSLSKISRSNGPSRSAMLWSAWWCVSGALGYGRLPDLSARRAVH